MQTLTANKQGWAFVCKNFEPAAWMIFINFVFSQILHEGSAVNLSGNEIDDFCSCSKCRSQQPTLFV